MQHTVNTSDSTPIRQQVSWITFALRVKVDNMMEEMLEQGITIHWIQPLQSPWANLIVLVVKKDGTTRFLWITEDSTP